MKPVVISGFAVLILSACAGEKVTAPDAPIAYMDLSLEVLETLSSDEMAGRRMQTEGHEKARNYLQAQILKSGFFDRYELQQFEAKKYNREGEVIGAFPGYNLIAEIDGDPSNEKPLLVITAHYDHLGVRDGKIYNGADDNASGCAALFAIAESFKQTRPDHDIFFAWVDAEETGLQGAFAVVADEKLMGKRKVFNLNLDMISQNKSEIYLVGTHHYPEIKPILKSAAYGTGVDLKFGHDRPKDGDQDWTELSDHFAFHDAGIPFAYFGVEDHKYYHHHKDEFDTIPLEFFKGSVQTVVNAAHILDENLETLARKPGGKIDEE